MIVCKKCGFNNADADTFCGSCGAFLEWTGEKVIPPAAVESAPEIPAAAEPARRGGFMALVQQVTTIGVPKKEAIDTPANIPGMPMAAPGPRPGMPGAPAPLGGPPATPRPMGPSAMPIGPPRSAPPSSPPPSGPPRSAPPSGPPGSITPTSAPPVGPPRSAPPTGPPLSLAPTSAPPAGPPRSAPPSGPPPAGGPTSAPPTGPPRSVPPSSPPPSGPPPSLPPSGPPSGAGGPGPAGAPTSPAPAPVAPSLPRPSLPPPTLPAPTPMVIRVTPEPSVAPPAGVSPLATPAATPAPAAPPPGAQPAASIQPAATQPAAMQPAALRPRAAPKPAAAPPTKRLRPGDLICGACGEGNDPVRKFCSRCGQSLSTATIAATPWYRRLIPHRKAKVLAAGERPKRRRGSGMNFGAIVRWGRNVVLVVVLLGGVAYGAIPGFRDTVNGKVNSVIQNFTAKTGTPTPVHASSVTATSSTTGHAASLAVDAFSNTYWAASLSKDAHPKLTVGFSPAVNVDVILFISGNTANELSEPRPKELHIVFSNGATQNLLLADEATSQQFNINGASKVTGVTIQIMSVYGSTSGNDVALSDVEFFGRQ